MLILKLNLKPGKKIPYKKFQITANQFYIYTFQLLEYRSEGKFDKQTSSDPTRRFWQFYDWGNLNASIWRLDQNDLHTYK